MNPQAISHYRITAKLGEGGMGEVYRASDSRLGRAVALKVLPNAFVSDLERLSRLKREAQVLASLNHPNIASIYGLEESGGICALVMELVEGPTLAERIVQGPMPLEEGLDLARQIAEALEYAHEHGIIHRDLKPANVKVTPEGTVKVLDFGLAKAAGTTTPSSHPESSPTLTMRDTRAGTILGTASYMAPEQARGKAVDRRADIWAFGVVLYEMLTGRRLFEGETFSDTLVQVLNKEPDWDRVPAKVQRLLRRCLEKDPKQRLRDIGDHLLLLEQTPTPQGLRQRSWLAWAVAGLCLAAAATFAGLWLTQPAPAEQPSVQFTLEAPADAAFTAPFAGVAVSPDSRFIVFVAQSDRGGASSLWLRSVDSLTARPLPRTERANLPFWSPDGKSLAFFADDKLKRMDLASGAAVNLCDAPIPNGGDWSRDGVMLFSSNGELWRVAAAGGEPAKLAAPDEVRQETSYDFPQFLPDAQRFLYFMASGNPNLQGIYAGSLGRPQERVRIVGTDRKALYVPAHGRRPGYLLWMRQEMLLAQQFDTGSLRLEGDPASIAEALDLGPAIRAPFWISGTGLLVYRSGGAQDSQTYWIGRDGKREVSSMPEDVYPSVRLSPDGRRAAFRREDAGNHDIWLWEFGRRVMTRLTFDLGIDSDPIWSPDGRQVVFRSNRGGNTQMYRKEADGGGQEERLTEGPNNRIPLDWSHDGRYILYLEEVSLKRSFDLWALPMEGGGAPSGPGARKPIAVAQTPFPEFGGRFSPDGKWVAYDSEEPGRREVYVQAFPAAGGKWQVSTKGGNYPVWRGDGKELFFIAPGGRLMAAAIRLGPTGIETDTPRELFTASFFFSTIVHPYDVTTDGLRFLVLEQTSIPHLTVVMNWQASLKP